MTESQSNASPALPMQSVAPWWHAAVVVLILAVGGSPLLQFSPSMSRNTLSPRLPFFGKRSWENEGFASDSIGL